MASGAKDGEGKVKQIKERDNKILFFFLTPKYVCEKVVITFLVDF